MAAAQNQNQICSCVYTGGGGVHVCIQVAAAQRLHLFCASVYSFQQPLKIRSVQQVDLVFLVVFFNFLYGSGLSYIEIEKFEVRFGKIDGRDHCNDVF